MLTRENESQDFVRVLTEGDFLFISIDFELGKMSGFRIKPYLVGREQASSFFFFF